MTALLCLIAFYALLAALTLYSCCRVSGRISEEERVREREFEARRYREVMDRMLTDAEFLAMAEREPVLGGIEERLG